MQHQGFFLVGGCWLGFRVSKYVFFAQYKYCLSVQKHL
jgi:hypothetical protein